MPELSLLIPARSEMFLSQTIENILENIEGDTEVIAVLDGDLLSFDTTGGLNVELNAR